MIQSMSQGLYHCDIGLKAGHKPMARRKCMEKGGGDCGIR